MTSPDPRTSAPPLRPRFSSAGTGGSLTLLALVLVPALVFTLWAGVALGYTYSSGMRVGFVQKFSRKGWICKTWEGELAMVNMPGALSQIFVLLGAERLGRQGDQRGDG